LHVLFLHEAREWSGTARLFARAGRGISERGAKVTLLVSPDSNVHMAVSPRREPGQPRHTPIPEPFEIIPFGTEGWFFSAARRLRHIFRRWDADTIFVSTDREHLIAATACWLSRSGSVVRWTQAGRQLEMGGAGRWGARLARTSYLFASEADRRASKIPKNAIDSSVAEIGIDVSTYPANGEKEPTAEGDSASDQKQTEPLKYIVCVYDPTSRGRAATAIRTISMLAPRHPNLRLIIVGPGSDDEDLRMQAAALRVLHLPCEHVVVPVPWDRPVLAVRGLLDAVQPRPTDQLGQILLEAVLLRFGHRPHPVGSHAARRVLMPAFWRVRPEVLPQIPMTSPPTIAAS